MTLWTKYESSDTCIEIFWNTSQPANNRQFRLVRTITSITTNYAVKGVISPTRIPKTLTQKPFEFYSTTLQNCSYNWTECYLYQWGYLVPAFVCLSVCLSFCLSVCLFVCWQLRVKTTVQIFIKILSDMFLWTRNNWLNFGSRLHIDPDPRIFEDFPTLRDRTFFPHFASHL